MHIEPLQNTCIKSVVYDGVLVSKCVMDTKFC